MNEIEVTVAEEGMTYVFASEKAVEDWSLRGIPTYIRCRAASKSAVDDSVSAVDSLVWEPR